MNSGCCSVLTGNFEVIKELKNERMSSGCCSVLLNNFKGIKK